MKCYEIGTGYTSIPPKISAATETVVYELSCSLQKLGVDVTILDMEDPQRKDCEVPIEEVPFPAWLRDSDVRLGLMHKVRRVLYSLSLTQKLQTILKNSKEPVILHFHNQYNQFFFQVLTPDKLRQKAKIVYTNHNGHWSREWTEAEALLRRNYFQEIACMKSADMVFVLNPKMEENLLQNLQLPKERVCRIGNGVNTAVYRPLSHEEKAKLHQKWGLEGYRLMLQVGSVNENKGQRRSLEYLLPQLKADKNLLFGYAGGIVDESYHRDLLALAKQKDVAEQLRYFGIIPPGAELNELYNCAEATLHSSDYEAFSLVWLESMAAAVPLVFCGKSKDLFPDELELVGSQNSAQLRQRVQERFSWDAIADQYNKVFESMEREC